MTFTHLLSPSGWTANTGLPLTDRGFRYGMSIFETIAIRASTPLLLEAHIDRLVETAAAAKFRPPAHWLEAARALFAKPPITEGVLRIYLTAGDRDGEESRVALLFETMPIPTALSRARAVTVEFTPALPFGKTGNYWPHLLAQPATGEEAILCAPLLLGGAMSNLFVIIDDVLLTPRQPVRRGIVRDWIAAAEADLTRENLTKAAGAFLTNSRMGLRELTAIDGRELPGHPQIQALWQRYRTEVLRAG